MPVTALVASLDLAAARCPDITPHVYKRLFAAQPDMQPLFCLDTNHAVKGEMLAQALQALLDFAEGGSSGLNMISCEMTNHAGYDVPPNVFSTFFVTISDTLCELLGNEWTPAMESAWSDVLARLQVLIAARV